VADWEQAFKEPKIYRCRNNFSDKNIKSGKAHHHHFPLPQPPEWECNVCLTVA